MKRKSADTKQVFQDNQQDKKDAEEEMPTVAAAWKRHWDDRAAEKAKGDVRDAVKDVEDTLIAILHATGQSVRQSELAGYVQGLCSIRDERDDLKKQLQAAKAEPLALSLPVAVVDKAYKFFDNPDAANARGLALDLSSDIVGISEGTYGKWGEASEPPTGEGADDDKPRMEASGDAELRELREWVKDHMPGIMDRYGHLLAEPPTGEGPSDA